MELKRTLASTLRITLKYPPEARFTPNGKYLVTFQSVELGNLYFQQWDDSSKPTVRDDTNPPMVSHEGTTDGLVELTTGTGIEVKGYTITQLMKTVHTGRRWMNVFTVQSWKLSPDPNEEKSLDSTGQSG